MIVVRLSNHRALGSAGCQEVTNLIQRRHTANFTNATVVAVGNGFIEIKLSGLKRLFSENKAATTIRMNLEADGVPALVMAGTTVEQLASVLSTDQLQPYCSLRMTDDCVCCGVCVAACPVGAIAEGGPLYVLDQTRCNRPQTNCDACVGVCVVQTIIDTR